MSPARGVSLVVSVHVFFLFPMRRFVLLPALGRMIQPEPLHPGQTPVPPQRVQSRRFLNQPATGIPPRPKHSAQAPALTHIWQQPRHGTACVFSLSMITSIAPTTPGAAESHERLGEERRKGCP